MEIERKESRLTRMVRLVKEFDGDDFAIYLRLSIARKLEKGNRYVLITDSLLDEEEPFDRLRIRTYEMIGTVTEASGIPVDSVIMKQVDGYECTIYSLTKSDCEFLGIRYQKGLQLFPKGMQWRHTMERYHEIYDPIIEFARKKELKEAFNEREQKQKIRLSMLHENEMS